MPSKNNGNKILGAVIVGVSVTVATWTAASMGQPEDITSDTGAPVTTESAPYNPIDDDRENVTDVACAVPTEDSDISTCINAGAFDPATHYDYVGGVGWIVVPDGYTYGNGNTPPTGQYLMDHPNPSADNPQLTNRDDASATADTPADDESEDEDSESGEGMRQAEDGSMVPDSFYDDTDYEPVYP